MTRAARPDSSEGCMLRASKPTWDDRVTARRPAGLVPAASSLAFDDVPILIAAAATASPSHVVDRDATRAWCRRLYEREPDLASRLRLIDHTGVERRALALPPDRIATARGFDVRNAEYAEAALPLAEEAARRALGRAGLAARDLDVLLTTSCTGILIPSLAAYLAPRLGLRDDVVRLPITELGCAAGAAGVARAAELCRGSARVAMVLAVELPTLTFQPGDRSMSNFVAASLFGDGAAAVILGAPERLPRPTGARVEVLGSRSHLFPASTRLMGFGVGDGGFQLVLARDVPEFLRGKVRPLVERLCAGEGVQPSRLGFAAIHPGGRRILANLEEELGLPRSVTAPSWQVLAGHGNMSSATVLFVLERVLASAAPGDGAYGLLAAFGPGFAAEMSVLRWWAPR